MTRTRIYRIDLARSRGGQVIGRSPFGAKRVIPFGGVSQEHTRPRVDSGELTTEDLGRCSGANPDWEKLVNGHPRLITIDAHVARRGVDLDAHFPVEQH